MLRSLLVPAILSEAIPATTQNVQMEIQNTTKLAFTYSGEFNCTSFSASTQTPVNRPPWTESNDVFAVTTALRYTRLAKQRILARQLEPSIYVPIHHVLTLIPCPNCHRTFSLRSNRLSWGFVRFSHSDRADIAMRAKKYPHPTFRAFKQRKTQKHPRKRLHFYILINASANYYYIVRGSTGSRGVKFEVNYGYIPWEIAALNEFVASVERLTQDTSRMH